MNKETQLSNRRQARRRRRQRKSSNWSIGLLIVLLLIGVWWLWPKAPSKQSQIKVTAGKKATKTTPSFTVVIFGTEKQNGAEKAAGVLLLTYNSRKRLVGGVVFDQNTFVDVPGKGFIQVKDGLTEPEKAAAALAQMAKVPLNGFLILPQEKFSNFVARLTPARFFTDYTRTKLSKLKTVAYAKAMKKVSKKKVLIVFLPVKPLTIGEATYFQPVKKDLTKLVNNFWDVKQVREEPRVIILNGNGLPGIARSAADKLLAGDFRIIDIKNAANFNYQKTEIITYTDLGNKYVKTVKQSLGVGIIKKNQIPQDVTDLVVILGKDYQK